MLVDLLISWLPMVADKSVHIGGVYRDFLRGKVGLILYFVSVNLRRFGMPGGASHAELAYMEF